MTGFIQRADVEGADIVGILQDYGAVTAAAIPNAVAQVLPNALPGLLPDALDAALPNAVPPIVNPLINAAIPPAVSSITSRIKFDSTASASANATLINSRLQALATIGGGTLYLSAGTWNVDQPIVIPNRCGIVGDSNSCTILRKDNSWTQTAPLIDCSGNGLGTGSNAGMRRNPTIRYLGLQGNGKPGIGINFDYSQGGDYQQIVAQGFPGNVYSAMQTWDSTFIAVVAVGCGGTTAGTEVWRILGSPLSEAFPSGDKSNMLRFYMCHVESQPGTAVFVSENGNGAGNGPFGIQFFGYKFESGVLQSNATVVDISNASDVRFFGDGWMNLKGANTSVTGVRGLCGAAYIDSLFVGVGSSTGVVSIVRTRNNAEGFHYGTIKAGNTSANLQMMVEVIASANGIQDRCAQIDMIVPFGSVPLIGGPGETDQPITSRQLAGTLRRTITTANNNALQRADGNRRIEYAGPSNGTLTIGRDGGGFPGIKTCYAGDEIIIDNSSAFTFTISSTATAGQEVAFIDKTGGGGVIPAGGVRRLYKKRNGNTGGTDPTTAGVAIWYML
jgi:hypothetical protein